jgi:hypothetical protein
MFDLSYRSVLFQDRVSSLVRENPLKVGGKKAHDDAPTPAKSVGYLKPRYSCPFGYKSPTPGSSS